MKGLEMGILRVQFLNHTYQAVHGSIVSSQTESSVGVHWKANSLQGIDVKENGNVC